MVRTQRQSIEAALAREVPVLVLDEERIVTGANLLLLWFFGALRIGEPCDPGQVIGQHDYETLARSIEQARISLEDPDNRRFIEERLRAVIGTEEERQPAVRHFLERVDRSRAARQWWEETTFDAHGKVIALSGNHCPVFLQQADGSRLHFRETVKRQADAGRLITYEPWEQDLQTREAVASAYGRIRVVYPHVAYVQDVRHLSAFFPAAGHDATPAQATMSSERQLPGGNEGDPVEGAGNSPRGTTTPAAEWRPTQVFPRAEIDATLDQSSQPLAPHPVYGPGFAWELAGSTGEVTRLEIFPERRWAALRYVDGSLQQQHRGLILDYLAVRPAETVPMLSLVSMREGRGTLVNIYPSGDVDEFFRRQPLHGLLPPEALIFAAPVAVPPPSPATPEQPALTVAEAAGHLGIGPEQVRVLLRAQRLPGFKRGGEWHVSPDAVAELQAKQRRQTAQGAEAKEQIAAYNQTYYERKKQDPAWRERRRSQAREAMRRKREREREATQQAS